MPIRYPLVLLLVGALALLLALRRARRRGRWRMVRAWRSRTLARRLFARHGANGVSYFATMGRTVRWVDPCRHGVVAYRVFGRTALAIGDPLAAPEHLPDVLAGFLAHCRRQGWTPAFYQTIDATLPHYRAHGLRAFAIGREAIVDLPSFTLQGKRMANVRHSVTHAERAGARMRFYAADRLPHSVRHDLRSISDEWLAAKGGAEMGFTMGRLSPDGRPSWGARVAVASNAAGDAQAFITLIPAGGGRGWMLDMMRRRRDVESGTMDLLIARAAEALRDEGFATLSLSLAPLASAEEDGEDAPALACKARELLYEKMGGAYSYRSLFTYKNKFGVRWEPRYLVYAGDAALPMALLATLRAHLPAPAGLVRRLPPARWLPGGQWRRGKQSVAGQRAA
ncbi:MAG TPA: phosphatidylglycerol lysyltransferase domain-containing protein [Chloroflexota bacterium]|nr:phosphatidylglycerol lysyltransferase domain-containing protein [Chloroflexota bacterium]